MSTMCPKSIDRITRVEVNGFRNFPKDFVVDLGNPADRRSTVIIGENGTGKTNFCEFLKFISARIGHSWERPYCETILGGNVFGKNQPHDIKWAINLESSEGPCVLRDGFIKDGCDGFVIDPREKREAAWRFLRKWEIHSGKPLNFIEAFRPASLSFMKEENPELFGEIDHMLHLALSDFDSPMDLHDPPERLPESMAYFLQLATICLDPTSDRAGLCVDMPETGLHPRAVDVLGILLREACQHMQVIVTTHSELLLRHFSIDEIVVFEKKNGVVRATRPAMNEKIRGLAQKSRDLGKMFVTGALEEISP
jgi:predicted ATPase